MQLITTIPELTTEIGGGWHCSIESSSFHFYHNPSLPPSMLGDLARLLATWHGSTLRWGEGSLFLLNQTKCVNFFSMIADEELLIPIKAQNIFFGYGLFWTKSTKSSPPCLYFAIDKYFSRGLFYKILGQIALNPQPPCILSPDSDSEMPLTMWL